MTEPAVFAPGLLAGRTALVSGGGTGIGLAIARELGGLGARVVVAGRTVETLEKAVAELRRDGIDAAAHPVNIRREDEVAALFAAMGERFGAIDILVNNAGGQFAAAPLDISANGFRAVVDLNLNGTWHMTRAFGAAAVAAGRGGKVVNIVLSLFSGLPPKGPARGGRARGAHKKQKN